MHKDTGYPDVLIAVNDIIHLFVFVILETQALFFSECLGLHTLILMFTNAVFAREVSRKAL